MLDKILVVDDEPNIRETVSFILQEEGYHVLTACDGNEALHLIRQEKPRVVLLDEMMPRGNGAEVCGVLRNDPDMKATPVVMLTARGQRTDQAGAWQPGADHYVTKPFEDDRILDVIEEYLGNPA